MRSLGMGFEKNHTKPIPTPKNGILQAATSNNKKQQAKSRFPCSTTAFHDKLQQSATG